MEAIHCFFNNATDLTPEEAKSVADRCFAKHTKRFLIALKPKKLILLGKQPYEVFEPYLENKIDYYEHSAINLEGLKIPVLRHLHPNRRVKKDDGGFYRSAVYDDFKSYCNSFDYGD